ncbi:peptide chain release factor N(5)-glutamine methyltransferase [Marinilabiliaceae bacterium ANBcel2]|nr:peptide chain release factor N(5)-glutamine methyltransferase [Marinilabiliaceae bacterium ANBcel2]
MRTVNDFIDYFKIELNNREESREIMSFISLLLYKIRGYELADIIVKGEDSLNEDELEFLLKATERLKNGEPIQHITSFVIFFGSHFKSDKRALIPRPETEELLEWIIISNSSGDYNILDIGTGSGCIAISLKKRWPKSKVEAWDVSIEALELAKENSSINNADVNFLEKNLFHHPFPDNMDIIVSNPPYVTISEVCKMRRNVLDYEPGVALFVPDDEPLLFYREIALKACRSLNSQGSLYFEINRKYHIQIKEMLLEMGFINVELRRDLFGNYRMVRAIWPGGDLDIS